MDGPACIGGTVNTSCVYSISLRLFPIWRINNEDFTEALLNQSPIYEVVNTYDGVTDIGSSLLKVFSISENTTFQCTFDGPVNTSLVGTVTVFGRYQCTVKNVCAVIKKWLQWYQLYTLL